MNLKFILLNFWNIENNIGLHNDLLAFIFDYRKCFVEILESLWVLLLAFIEPEPQILDAGVYDLDHLFDVAVELLYIQCVILLFFL